MEKKNHLRATIIKGPIIFQNHGEAIILYQVTDHCASACAYPV